MVVVTHNRSLGGARRPRAAARGRPADAIRTCARSLPDAVRQLPGARCRRAPHDDREQRRAPAASVRAVRGGARRGDDRRDARSIRSASSCRRCSSRSAPASADARHAAPSAARRWRISARPGGWGCARCYTTFEASMRELLRRVHGSHAAHRPAVSRRRMTEMLETRGGARRAARAAASRDRAASSSSWRRELRDRIRVIGMTLDLSLLPDGGVRLARCVGRSTRTSCCRRASGWRGTSRLCVHRAGARRRAAAGAGAGARGAAARAVAAREP